MHKIKDFLYNWNDILVVLVIVILAGLLIYWRTDSIMNYPKTLASAISSSALPSDTETPASAETPTAPSSSETESPSTTEPSGSAEPSASVWNKGKLRASIKVSIEPGSASQAVQALVEAGLFSSYEDYVHVCEANDIDPGRIQVGSFTFEKGATQADIVNTVTAS